MTTATAPFGLPLFLTIPIQLEARVGHQKKLLTSSHATTKI